MEQKRTEAGWGGSSVRAAKTPSLTASPALPIIVEAGGNNSVVECNLAKVEVAGSNPVSRSMNT